MKKHCLKSSRRELGFTLIEVMVAVMIMSIVAVALTPVWVNEYNEKRTGLAIEETQVILDAARIYRTKYGAWPGGTTCLTAVSELKNMSPPLLSGVSNTNKFNLPLSTSCTATTFSIDQQAILDWDGVMANGLAATVLVGTPANSLRTTIGIPGSEPALDSKLSRVATGNAEMNRMQTTLLLGNNNITEVAHIDAQSINVRGATTTSTLDVITNSNVRGTSTTTSLDVMANSNVRGTSTTTSLDVMANSYVRGTSSSTYLDVHANSTLRGSTQHYGSVSFGSSTDFSQAANFREDVILSKVVSAGTWCGNLGALARTPTGATVSCQSYVWSTQGLAGPQRYQCPLAMSAHGVSGGAWASYGCTGQISVSSTCLVVVYPYQQYYNCTPI